MTTYSTEESSGTWYRKEPVTKGTSAIPNLVATKKRPIKSNNHEIRDSLFKFSSNTLTSNTEKRKMPTPHSLSSSGGKVKTHFIANERVLKGGGKAGQMSQIFVNTIQVAKNH